MTLANKNMMILQQPQKRNFMWWRIPVLFLTMSSKKRKMVISGLVSGTALLGFILGPLSLLVVGSIAGFITMRLWRQTRAWWRYLPTMNNAIQNTSLYSMLRMQVGQHRAEDHVRALTIQKIKSWAHTDQGKRIFLNEFNVDHVDDLNFLPNHATATFTTNSIQQNSNVAATATETKKQISIQFCVESEEREDSGGIGGCMVTVDAYVDPNNGNISFRQIKLSSPAWATDEFLPLEESRNRDQEKVIEGEFKNV
ncbi:hypothetical protein BJ944DRAFT_258423 [Cunninghamella echinulata]|nr:hypothetical protein BJ944DRAFT_258423 [Cunninghamella echinulata]